MHKRDLIARIAARASLPERSVQVCLDAAFVEILEQVVAGERIAWPGFGTFTRVWHAPRTSRNPRTGRLLQVHPRYSLRFRPSSRMQEKLRTLVPILTDPEHVRARRTARTLIDDLKLYHLPLIDFTRKTGTASEELLGLLTEVRLRYQERVAPEITHIRNYLEEELAALLRLPPPPPTMVGSVGESTHPQSP